MSFCAAPKCRPLLIFCRSVHCLDITLIIESLHSPGVTGQIVGACVTRTVRIGSGNAQIWGSCFLLSSCSWLTSLTSLMDAVQLRSFVSLIFTEAPQITSPQMYWLDQVPAPWSLPVGVSMSKSLAHVYWAGLGPILVTSNFSMKPLSILSFVHHIILPCIDSPFQLLMALPSPVIMRERKPCKDE